MRRITRKKKPLVHTSISMHPGYPGLFDTIRDGVLILDGVTGAIRYSNPALAALLGYTPQELIGIKIWDLSAFRDLDEGKAAFLMLEDESDRPNRLPLVAKSGRLVQVEYDRRAYPLGKQRLIQYNFRDIRESSPAYLLLGKLRKEIDLLYESGQLLNRTLDIESLYDNFSHLTAEMMHYEMIFVSTYDPATQLIRCVYAIANGKRLDISEFPPIPLEEEGRGTQSRVIRSGKPWLIRDYQLQMSSAQNTHIVDMDDGKFVDPDQVPEDAEIIRSAMIVPIILKEQVVGVVQIFNYQLDAFTEEDLSVVSTFASQFAVASNNALLYEHAQMEILERTRVEEALREHEFWLTESQRVGRIGSYVFDLQTNSWTSSEVLDEIFGIEKDYPKNLESWNSLVHPDRRQAMLEYFECEVVAARHPFNKEYPIMRVADGVTRWVWGHGDLKCAPDGSLQKMVGTIQDVTERKQAELEIFQAYDATIEGWSRAMDLRDKETEGHTLRVTDMTVKLARVFHLSESELVQVRWGALLHDIGKMGVPDDILLKKGPLSEDEWVIMRRHAALAYEMLLPIGYLRSALDIPYCHHEKWDGSGYPRKLRSEEIPLTARIFAVVDVWDALNSDRPYRPAWQEEHVLDYLRAQSATHFDPQVLKVCLESGLLVRQQPAS
jgi:PAS domain S-box-containing protein/putative nucleotidyltransferase with HDIG domain